MFDVGNHRYCLTEGCSSVYNSRRVLLPAMFDAVCTVATVVQTTIHPEPVPKPKPGVEAMSESSADAPPKVWTWDKENGGQFASINRPVAGATHDKELPVGGGSTAAGANPPHSLPNGMPPATSTENAGQVGCGRVTELLSGQQVRRQKHA